MPFLLAARTCLRKATEIIPSAWKKIMRAGSEKTAADGKLHLFSTPAGSPLGMDKSTDPFFLPYAVANVSMQKTRIKIKKNSTDGRYAEAKFKPTTCANLHAKFCANMEVTSTFTSHPNLFTHARSHLQMPIIHLVCNNDLSNLRWKFEKLGDHIVISSLEQTRKMRNLEILKGEYITLQHLQSATSDGTSSAKAWRRRHWASSLANFTEENVNLYHFLFKPVRVIHIHHRKLR